MSELEVVRIRVDVNCLAEDRPQVLASLTDWFDGNDVGMTGFVVKSNLVPTTAAVEWFKDF